MYESTSAPTARNNASQMPAIGERLHTDQGRLAPLVPETYRASAALNGRSMAARVMTIGLRSYIRTPVEHLAEFPISCPAAFEEPFLPTQPCCMPAADVIC